MELRAILSWLNTLPCEDAAWIMELAVRQLGGISDYRSVEFELAKHGVLVEEVMEWCSGVGLDDGIDDLCSEKGIECTTLEREEYIFQFAVRVVSMIADACLKKRGDRDESR